MIAINFKLALKNFYDAGWNTEALMMRAAEIIKEIKPATDGYWYPDDIAKAIKQNSNTLS